MNAFDHTVAENSPDGLRSARIQTIQVNVGLRCNQTCRHCHLAASPTRGEHMDWPTMEAVVDAAKRVQCKLVDITGGAPELHPHLRQFISRLRAEGIQVQLRTNLTALLGPGQADMPEFLRDHRVKLVASMPCYLEENVREQRGPEVYEKSIEAIRRLNHVGYGRNPGLTLDLVYNPVGPFLPPGQSELEDDYRKELGERFGISFTRLLTITNVPLGRFRADLEEQNQLDAYVGLLRQSFNPDTLDGLMCRRQIGVGWDGRLYDCDFNLATGQPVSVASAGHISRFDPEALAHRKIVTDDYCFACTAGSGSSCGGVLVPDDQPLAG